MTSIADFPWRPLTPDELEARYAQLELRAKTPLRPEFTTEIIGPGRWAYLTEFLHRDGRFWRGRISPLHPGRPRRLSVANFLVSVRSTGCRPLLLHAAGADAGKRSVERFANLPLRLYARWVADAEDTYDFPAQGPIMSVSYNEPGAEQGTVRVVRVRCTTDSQWTVLPTEQELDTITATCMPQGTCLPGDLNAVGTTYVTPSVRVFQEFHIVPQVMDAPLRDLVGEPVEPTSARERNRQRLLAAQANSLTAPVAREHRAIQL